MRHKLTFHLISFFALVVCLILAMTAKSQELLNASKRQIEKSPIVKNGILRTYSKINPGLDPNPGPGPHYLMIYIFPDSIAKKTDIYDVEFFLYKDKCYGYMVRYGSDRLKQQLIQKFDSAKSGFKRTDKSFKWTNANGDVVKLLDVDRGGMKLPNFILDIHEKE